MPLEDPVAVYNAETNVEAQMVKLLLIDAGIEAHASEDLSPVGLWMFGLLPEIHKPQVWVSRHDIDRAGPVLRDYAERTAQREREKRRGATDEERTVSAVCEECGETSTFPESKRGTVQDCRRCGAYIDVGDFDEQGDFWEQGSDEAGPP